MKYGCDQSPVPIWRDGLTHRQGYAFLAVPEESTEYQAVCALPNGSGGGLKIKFYPDIKPFVFEETDRAWLGGQVTHGSGPYLRGWFSIPNIDKLLTILRKNPRLNVAPGTAEEICRVLFLGQGREGDGLGWHPGGNGICSAEVLETVQAKRRQFSSFVIFKEQQEATISTEDD